MDPTRIAQHEGFTLMPLVGVPDDVLEIARSLDVSGLSSIEVRQAIGELRVWLGIGASLEARLRDHALQLSAAADSSVNESDRPSPDAGSGEGLFSPVSDPGVAPETLDADAGLSPAEGRRRHRRSRCLKAFPSLAARLTDGRCSTDHVDVVATEWDGAEPAVAARLVEHDREIAVAANNRPPAQLRRFVQRLITRIAAELGIERAKRIREKRSLRHWFSQGEGFGRLNGQFTSGDYQRLVDVLDRAAGRLMNNDRTLTREQATADALVGLICGDLDRSGPAATSVGVLIDLTTLTTGLHDSSVCEYVNGSPVDVRAVREMATSAGITPIVIDGAGLPLDVGRSRRLATTAQRTALAAVHATCMVPDCDSPFDRCEIHHIVPWEDGGLTNLANLGPLCSACHHHVHDRGWQIEVLPDRSVVVTRSDGTTIIGRPDRQPHTAGAP